MEKTNKKKMLISVLCVALVLAIGTGVAFASNALEKSMVKMQDGKISISRDDGQTWDETIPDNMTVIENEDGSTLVTMGTPPADGAPQGDCMMSKMVDGVMMFSTDGETWSDKLPDGVTVTEDGGMVTIRK